MSNEFPVAPLNKVLYLSSDPITIDDTSSYPIAGVYSFGRGLFARQPLNGSETTYKFFHRLHKDDLVLSQLKGWEGALARVSESFDGWFLSPQFQTFHAMEEKINIDYLEWYCKQSRVWEELKNKSHGMGARRDTVSPNQFLSLTIPLPPLEEQHRIVARIEELAAKIEEAQGLRREANHDAELFYLKSLLKAFEPYFAQTVPIGSVFKVTTGSTPSRSNPHYWEGIIKWVSSGEVAFYPIYDTKEKITEEGLENSSAKIYPPNTVLIAMIGQGKTRGQTAILNCYAATNQNIAGIHVYETDHSAEYVYWWLRSRYIQSRLIETGTAQPALNGAKIKDMPIALPTRKQQDQVVMHLNRLKTQIDRLKRKQAEASAELDALLPSILNKAFKGEL